MVEVEDTVVPCYHYPISSKILWINVYLILLKPWDFINVFKQTLLLINLVLYSLSAFYSLFVFKYSFSLFIYF